MNVLVDTSVWSLALRRKPRDLNARESRVVQELRELIREGRAVIIGLIRQELLSGIKDLRQFEELRRNLTAFPDERIETPDHELAAKASNDCRSRGIAVSLVDMLICAVAISRGMPIFSTDPDFEHYAAVLKLKLHVSNPAT